MLFSIKRRTFYALLIAFLEYTEIFAHFKEKDQLHRLNISEVIDPEICGYCNACKLLL